MSLRVLIVDDAEVMRDVLKSILRKNGFEIVGEADNGETAAQLYLLHRPDIVTLDVVMPGTTGLDAIQAILAVDPGARIIMCTADCSREAVVESLKAGAKDFVIKPFNVERLIQAIHKACSD